MCWCWLTVGVVIQGSWFRVHCSAEKCMHHREKGWDFDSASATVIQQSPASRRQKEIRVWNGWAQAAVSRQERFSKMHSLSPTCYRIIQALLQLLNEFPSWPKMPVLPGQALTFMAPDGTKNGCFWIQLIKTTDRNPVLCGSQLFPWTGKGMHWITCFVVMLLRYAVLSLCM